MKSTLRTSGHMMRSSFATWLIAVPAIVLAAAAFQGCGSDESSPGSGPATGGTGGSGETGGTGGDGGTAGEAGTGGTGGAAPDRHVVVLYTSDEHSHLFASNPEVDDFPAATAAGDGTLWGGVARRAALIAQERAAATTAGKDVLLLSAGDNQMGTLATLAFQYDAVDYAMMKSLGYDATTIGNHEMDFGPKALAQALAAAKAGDGMPHVVASNLHFSDTESGDDDLAALYSTDPGADKPLHQYLVLTTAGGVKVGLIGYVGINAQHDAPNKAPASFSPPVDPSDDGDADINLPNLYADLQPIVDKLRNDEKVDLVIGLGHAGVDDPSTAEGIAEGEDTRVCQNVKGIDLIISGHRHQHEPEAMKLTNLTDQRPCVVVNGGSYGIELGRIDLTIPGDASQPVSFDAATQTLLPIDDTMVPDASMASRLEEEVVKIEASGAQGSELASMLSHAEGTPITNDTSVAGDLYFRKLAETDFDITDTHAQVWLAADSMLAAADALAAEGVIPHTDLAAESAGIVRSRIRKGKTGAISAADAFNVVPLGASPVDDSPGYPLIRAYLSLLEIRVVVEFSLALGPTDSNFDLGFSGIEVDYDVTRPPATKLIDMFDPTKGQIMRIALDTDHSDGFEQYDEVIYDRANSIGDDGRLLSVVVSSYLGQFAGDAGAKLKDENGIEISIIDGILKRTGASGDGTEVKEAEAFMGYIFASPGGKLPATYDISSPSFSQRWFCTNGC